MIDVRGAGERARAAAVHAIRAVFSRRAVPAWMAAGALSVGVAALIGFGAFDTAQHEPAAVAIGEEVRLPTYTVTVLDVEITDAVEEQFIEADPGESLLLVTMRLENLTDATIGVATTTDRITSRLLGSATPLLTLSGVADPGIPQIWRDVGVTKDPLLQPGVPAEVTVAWRVASSELDPGTIALEVHEAVVRSGQIIISSDVVTWARGEMVALIDLETGR